jgi:hypothetical protein
MATVQPGRAVTSGRPVLMRQLAASVLFGLVIVYVVVLLALAEPPTLAARPGLAGRPGLAQHPTLPHPPALTERVRLAGLAGRPGLFAESPTSVGSLHSCPPVSTGDPAQPSGVRPTPSHTPRTDPSSGQVVSEPAASLAAAGNRCRTTRRSSPRTARSIEGEGWKSSPGSSVGGSVDHGTDRPLGRVVQNDEPVGQRVA